MLIGQWWGYFFLILLVKRAKLLAHDWSSGCLATVYAIEKLLLKMFCDNGVSFRDSWWGMYRRLERQERKWKHKEKHGILEERFQLVDVWKKLPSKFSRVRERCPRLNTVAVLCRVTQRKRGWLRARLPESNAGITGEISKIKSLSKVHHPRQGFLTPEKS